MSGSRRPSRDLPRGVDGQPLAGSEKLFRAFSAHLRGFRDAMARSGMVVTPDGWARFSVEHAGHLLRQILKLPEIETTEELLLRLALHDTEGTDHLRERLDDVWEW